MAITEEEVKKAEATKGERSIEIEMIDGKISAEFCVCKGSYETMDYSEVCYEKIFDDWTAFQKWADFFFALED